MAFAKRKLAQHIDKKILMRMRIFALIFVVMVGIMIWDVVNGSISFWLLLIAVALGTLFGLVASRMFKLTWDKDGKKIVGRLDTIGIIVLVIYIGISLFRQQLIGVFIHGPLIGVFSVSFLAGSFLGQIVGVRNGIKGIFKAEGIGL